MRSSFIIRVERIMTLFLQLGAIGGETRRRTVGIRWGDYYCIIIHVFSVSSGAE